MVTVSAKKNSEGETDKQINEDCLIHLLIILLNAMGNILRVHMIEQQRIIN